MTCPRCHSPRHDTPVTWAHLDPALTGRDSCRVDVAACYLGCTARTLYSELKAWNREHGPEEPSPRGAYHVGRKVLISTVVLGEATGRSRPKWKTAAESKRAAKKPGRLRGAFRLFAGGDAA